LDDAVTGTRQKPVRKVRGRGKLQQQERKGSASWTNW